MKAKIAIVTDVSLFSNIFIPLLRKENANIIIDICSSIDEIDEKFRRMSHDLILMDGGMTQLSSFEAIQHIRLSKQSNVPIWFFPEILTDQYLMKCKTMGVCRIIPKPFNPLKVCQEIFSIEPIIY